MSKNKQCYWDKVKTASAWKPPKRLTLVSTYNYEQTSIIDLTSTRRTMKDK